MSQDQFLKLLDASRGYLMLGVSCPFTAGQPFRLYLRRAARAYLAGVDDRGRLTGKPALNSRVLLAEAPDLESIRRRREYFSFHLEQWREADRPHRSHLAALREEAHR